MINTAKIKLKIPNKDVIPNHQIYYLTTFDLYLVKTHPMSYPPF